MVFLLYWAGIGSFWAESSYTDRKIFLAPTACICAPSRERDGMDCKESIWMTNSKNSCVISFLDIPWYFCCIGRELDHFGRKVHIRTEKYSWRLLHAFARPHGSGMGWIARRVFG